MLLGSPFHALSTSQDNGHTETVIHPRQQSDRDQRTAFVMQVLRESLALSAPKMVLQPSPFNTQQNRALRLLDSEELDVVWTATTEQRERDYRAVTIPIYQGLLGWRIMLMKSTQGDLLAGKPKLEALRKLIIGAGGSWPEVAIFSQSGFTLHTATTYDGLFDMLSMGRFDLFPRSVIEIKAELDAFGELGLIADPHLLIRYPYALYFFVRKSNETLANHIETGLVMLIESGRYQMLFDEFVASSFAEFELDKRHVIHLDNPSFPKPADKYRKYFRQ